MGKKYWYNNVRTVEVGVSEVTGTALVSVPIWKAPFRCTVERCYVIPKGNVTGRGTDYMTLAILNKGTDGTGTVGDSAIASIAFTAGENASAFVQKDLGAVTLNKLNKNEVLCFDRSVAGTGMTMPASAVVIEYSRR